MKLEKVCINCKTTMKFTEKEIKRLTKKEQERIEERNKSFLKMLDEEETVGWKKKRKRKVYASFTRSVLKAGIIKAYGHIICPVCNTDQLLVEDLN